MAKSSQSLSEADRRHVARWAADCAARVLYLFENDTPCDHRPRLAIQRAYAYARGELDTREEIRRRFDGGGAFKAAGSPAGAAAARAAGQAVAVSHMGAHALGAAAYAVKATGLAAIDTITAEAEEIDWQLANMSAEVRAALRQLPAIGVDRSGPLGPGLLASGHLGTVIARIQRGLGHVSVD